MESPHSPPRSPIAEPAVAQLVARLAQVPGVAALALGGSRARGTAGPASDFDVGLYFRSGAPFDARGIRAAVAGILDAPDRTTITPIGEWGPWIVGGGWLSVNGRKVDLLYRDADAVRRVIEACRAGDISMNYQPGHPHGFCSAIWMGEAALCLPLHDPHGLIAGLKQLTTPYPEALRAALVRRFRWEVLFSIENAELAVGRDEQTHVAGCAYRALACLGQVLFALNRRYLINEKGALAEAGGFPATIPHLADRVGRVWQALGRGDLAAVCAALRRLNTEMEALSP